MKKNFLFPGWFIVIASQHRPKIVFLFYIYIFYAVYFFATTYQFLNYVVVRHLVEPDLSALFYL